MFRECVGHTRVSIPRRGDGSGRASSPGRHGWPGLPDGNDEDASRGQSKLCDVLWGNTTARRGWIQWDSHRKRGWMWLEGVVQLGLKEEIFINVL